MRILLVIDGFGSGGAQRQLVSLAGGLSRSGHLVEFFVYHSAEDFFRSEVESLGVNVTEARDDRNGFSLKTVWELRTLLTHGRFDAALAFLDSPSIYLLLAGMGLKVRLVVSDRSSFLKASSVRNLWLKRQLFRFADAVVCNSQSQRRWLVERAGLAAGRVWCIYNGYDEALYKAGCRRRRKDAVDLRLIGVGRIAAPKNIELLIRGMREFSLRQGWLPRVRWVGRIQSPGYKESLDAQLADAPAVAAVWSWLGEREDVVELMRNSDALVVPSLYEGLPNVVCEALHLGLPVIASNVCDNSMLLGDGTRGFLFESTSPRSFAKALERFCAAADRDLESMVSAGRRYACEALSLSEMVKRYESVLSGLT